MPPLLLGEEQLVLKCHTDTFSTNTIWKHEKQYFFLLRNRENQVWVVLLLLDILTLVVSREDFSIVRKVHLVQLFLG